MQCPHCGSPIICCQADPLPPWCIRCGAELGPNFGHKRVDSGESSLLIAASSGGAGRATETRAEDAHASINRTSWSNFAIGSVIAAPMWLLPGVNQFAGFALTTIGAAIAIDSMGRNRLATQQ
jgi:hypothetical protein